MPLLKDNLKKISKSILEEMVELLAPMKAIRMELCCDNKPTFHLVPIVYDKIMELLTRSDDEKDRDSQSITVLKSRFTSIV